jgi:hypothetical protein
MSAASGTRCKRVQEIQGISLGVPKIGIELRSSLLTTTRSEQEKILLEGTKSCATIQGFADHGEARNLK